MTVTLGLQRIDNMDVEKMRQAYAESYWWPELMVDLDLTRTAADFYLLYAMADGDSDLRKIFEEYSMVLAKQVAIYLDASIGGEMRHYKHNQKGYSLSPTRKLARREWRELRVKTGLEPLERALVAFNDGKNWKSMYGGPKWGRITDTLLRHLRRETSSLLFVDQTLALQHNTGTVFSKMQNYWRLMDLKKVLDANLHEQWWELTEFAKSNDGVESMVTSLFRSWLTAEAEVRIPSIEYSRPRQLIPEVKAVNGFVLGDLVEVAVTAKNSQFHGERGTVKSFAESPKPGVFIQLSGFGKPVEFSRTNLKLIERKEQSWVDYLEV